MIPHADRERLESELSDVRKHLDTIEGRLREEAEKEQHDMVDHLEEHLDAVEGRFRALREFIQYVFKDAKQEASSEEE